jgi:protein SCO1/2
VTVAPTRPVLGKVTAHRRIGAALAFCLMPVAAQAGLSEAQLAAVVVAPPRGARAPLDMRFRDRGGTEIALAEATGGRPTLLMPVDYTCRETCGPAMSIAAGALRESGLAAGRDYSVVVVGIDPRDGPAEARRFTDGQIDGPGVSVLSGDAAATQTLMRAIGYGYVVDEQNGAVAHPAGFVALAPDGRVTRALSSLALTPTDLKLALIEAGDGKIGGVAGRLALLCYGFDAVHGIYTRQITALLQIAGAATVALLAGAIAWMAWRSPRRGAGA